jgi:ribokinase
MSAKIVVVGSYVQDLAFRMEQFPSGGETRLAQFALGPGGKGFNQAVAAHRQGVATTFVGAVGNDPFSGALQSFLQTERLPVLLETHSDAHTGAAGILVNGKAENLIAVALGANAKLSVGFVHHHAALLSKAQVLLTQLESALPATQEALAIVKRNGGTTILNPAPINPEVTMELLGAVDILVPNESEFAFLSRELLQRSAPTNLEGLPDQEWRNILKALTVPTLLVTLGQLGAVLVHHGEVRRIAAIDANAVDTTGAGDAFCGGLAAGLIHFAGDLPEAAHYATVVAGLSTEQRGTAPAMPTRTAVLSRWRSQNPTAQAV